MTNPEVAILMLCLFIILVLLGFPIAFTLIAMGVGFGYYAYYQAPDSFADLFNNQIFYLLNQNTYSVMENDTFRDAADLRNLVMMRHPRQTLHSDAHHQHDVN